MTIIRTSADVEPVQLLEAGMIILGKATMSVSLTKLLKSLQHLNRFRNSASSSASYDLESNERRTYDFVTGVLAFAADGLRSTANHNQHTCVEAWI